MLDQYLDQVITHHVKESFFRREGCGCEGVFTGKPLLAVRATPIREQIIIY